MRYWWYGLCSVLFPNWKEILGSLTDSLAPSTPGALDLEGLPTAYPAKKKHKKKMRKSSQCSQTHPSSNSQFRKILQKLKHETKPKSNMSISAKDTYVTFQYVRKHIWRRTSLNKEPHAFGYCSYPQVLFVNISTRIFFVSGKESCGRLTAYGTLRGRSAAPNGWLAQNPVTQY